MSGLYGPRDDDRERWRAILKEDVRLAVRPAAGLERWLPHVKCDACGKAATWCVYLARGVSPRPLCTKCGRRARRVVWNAHKELLRLFRP